MTYLGGKCLQQSVAVAIKLALLILILTSCFLVRVLYFEWYCGKAHKHTVISCAFDWEINYLSLNYEDGLVPDLKIKRIKYFGDFQGLLEGVKANYYFVA